MSETVINIAKQFSSFPFGRYKDKSDTSGQAFRDDILIPALEKFDTVTIELDGAQGYGSSFLEETFGGLIRAGFKYVTVKDRICFVSKTDPSLPKEIQGYMTEAQEKMG